VSFPVEFRRLTAHNAYRLSAFRLAKRVPLDAREDLLGTVRNPEAGRLISEDVCGE
jgi:hypothetical protein